MKTGRKEDVIASRSAVKEEGNIISLIDLELRKVSICRSIVYLRMHNYAFLNLFYVRVRVCVCMFVFVLMLMLMFVSAVDSRVIST